MKKKTLSVLLAMAMAVSWQAAEVLPLMRPRRLLLHPQKQRLQRPQRQKLKVRQRLRQVMSSPILKVRN